MAFQREELEQLSFNLASRKTKKRVVKTTKGLFTTVYHEPLIAWVYRKYVSRKENTLIYAKTAAHEFIYRTKKDVTEVMVNDRMIGSIDAEGALRVKGGKTPVASIKHEAKLAYFPITVNGKEVGGLTNAALSSQVNPRAFQLLNITSEEELLLFLVLAIHEMVKLSI